MNFLAQPGSNAMIGVDRQMMGRESTAKGRTPIRATPQVSTSEKARLDAMARQNGFNNYEEMRAFLLRRQQAEGGVAQRGQVEAGVDNAMSWHPRNLLNYVVGKYKGATGQ